jgi:hypothetical protein
LFSDGEKAITVTYRCRYLYGVRWQRVNKETKSLGNSGVPKAMVLVKTVNKLWQWTLGGCDVVIFLLANMPLDL